MNKSRMKFGALLAVMLIVSMALVPAVSAYGPIAHVSMANDARTDTNTDEYLTGSIGPDSGMGWGWWYNYHGNMASDVGGAMYNKALTAKEKSFARGWKAHIEADRVAHGSGYRPLDATYGIGYIDKVAQDYSRSHRTVEIGLDGRIFYEHDSSPNFYLDGYPVATSLIKRTMNDIYPDSISESDILFYYKATMVVYAEDEVFWNSAPGWLLYVGMYVDGIYADYDDNNVFIPGASELINPYSESVNLINSNVATNSVFTSPLIYSSGKDNLNVPEDNLTKIRKKYRERLISEGIITTEIEHQNDGWDNIKVKFDTERANLIYEEMFNEMNSQGIISEKIYKHLAKPNATKQQILKDMLKDGDISQAQYDGIIQVVKNNR